MPYIFFIVRPDGIRSYYEARTRLERIGIAFGYELADAEWAIDVPNLDDPATWEGSPPPLNPGSVAASPVRESGRAGDGPTGGGGGIDPRFVWPRNSRGRLPPPAMTVAAVGARRFGVGRGTAAAVLWRPAGARASAETERRAAARRLGRASGSGTTRGDRRR